MSAITLSVNGRSHTLDVDPSTPLLWVLRDHLGMTGTKFSCGEDIDSYVSNICRCGTYPRVRAAIHRASGTAS